jgi:hypothetical protein
MTPEEVSLLYLLASRHNSLFAALTYFATGTAPLQTIAGLCARELLIQEWRNIAQEYVSAGSCFFSQNLGQSPPFLNFSFAQQGVVPLEVGAAQMFMLHHVPATATSSCTSSVLGSGYDRTCLSNAANNNLIMQRGDIATMSSTDFAAATRAPQFGLPSVDAYLATLGASSYNYAGTMNSHLNIGLHLSPAEWAINFGFLQNLLTTQSALRNASTACLALAQASSDTAVTQMQQYMPGGARAITPCSTISCMLGSFSTGSAPRSGPLFYDTGTSC